MPLISQTSNGWYTYRCFYCEETYTLRQNQDEARKYQGNDDNHRCNKCASVLTPPSQPVPANSTSENKLTERYQCIKCNDYYWSDYKPNASEHVCPKCSEEKERMTDRITFDELRKKISLDQDRFSELFHAVDRILPENRKQTEVVESTRLATEAVKLMQELGLSQIPVIEKESVLGLFSYRAFALEIANSRNLMKDVTSLTVFDCLGHGDPEYAGLTDEFRGIISKLRNQDSVIVSGPDAFDYILTTKDVLLYLYSVANRFILVEEIEYSIRALIREAVPNAETFSACVVEALSFSYKDRESDLPRNLEEMTFDQYIALIRNGNNWQYFKKVFGANRDGIRGRLEGIRDLRNDVFHFRRELSEEELDELYSCRGWLGRCVNKIRARGEGGR